MIDDILVQIGFFPRAILLAIPITMAYLFVQDCLWKKKMIEILRKPTKVLFFIYLSFVLISTVLTRYNSYPLLSVTKDFGIIKNGSINHEFVENVLLFIPYTFLFLQGFKQEKPWRASTVLSIFTSITIESIQLILWVGQFQLSDIVHNTIGGICGCVIWLFCQSIIYFICDKKSDIRK